VEGLEHEADRVPPQPGQTLLAHPVDALPGQVQFAGQGPVQAAEQVQQRRLPATAGPHHRQRLPGGHIQVDAVDRADQSRLLAVLLAQPAGPHHRRAA
jgi:hypothetical protein